MTTALRPTNGWRTNTPRSAGFYDKLGIGDRTEIEFFNGPHTINGAGTFDFLHRHLNWPKPE